MKNSLIIVMTLALVLGAALTADALLIDRGNGMIYSTTMNVTWLQDMNYAQTSGYDADGQMSWNDATAWASNLSYGGFDDWRLPTFDALNAGQYNGATRLHEMAYLSEFELDYPRGDFYPQDVYPFVNIPAQELWYWTSTLATPDEAWRFDLQCG